MRARASRRVVLAPRCASSNSNAVTAAPNLRDDGAVEELWVRPRPERDRIVERERTEVGEVEVSLLDELPRFAQHLREVGNVPMSDVAREHGPQPGAERIPAAVEREGGHRVVGL